METPVSGSGQPSLARPQVSQFSLLSLILRGGVIISATIIAFGLILFLITGTSGYTADTGTKRDYTAFHDEANGGPLYFPLNPPEIIEGVAQFKPFAIIMLGLILLIATPVLNVALAGLSFLKQRDLAFTLISLFVLAILALSFLLGKAGG